MKRSTLGIYQFNQAVGAVVLICAALFVGALVNAGLLKEWFQTSLTLRIVLPEAGVSGLAQGAEVQIMGTRAGEIRRIVIDPSQRMHAEARIDSQMRPFLRRDLQVVIRRQFGIAGAAFLDISRGTGPELDWGFAVLTATTDRAPTDLIGQVIDEVHARVLPILDELQKVIANANTLVDPAGPLRQTMQSAATMVQRIERGEGSIGKLSGRRQDGVGRPVSVGLCAVRCGACQQPAGRAGEDLEGCTPAQHLAAHGRHPGLAAGRRAQSRGR